MNSRRVRSHTGIAIVLVASLAVAAPASATTQVDCDTTADFCTGDPCVTSDSLEITVSSCTLNFGSATLRIENKVRLAVDGATLSLTAANIEVNAKIDGKHTDTGEPNGSDVTLTTSGNITVNRKIDVSARGTAGSITLDAGGNIAIGHQLLARAKGGGGVTATGGIVTVEADGTVTSTKRGKLIARGKKKNTDAGEVSVSGVLGVDLDGRIEVRGLNAGTAAVTSSGGNVVFDEEIRAFGEFGNGGRVMLDTPVGDVAMNGVIRAKGGGIEGGGDIDITGDVVSVLRIDARGRGHSPGGSINIVGSTIFSGRILANGGDDGGSVSVISVVNPPGGITLDERIDVDGRIAGGSVIVSTPYDATILAEIDARGDVTGGEAHFHADGNLVLGGGSSDKYRATSDGVGGTFEADTTTGNLTVSGVYTVQIGGCIGLSAGGVLDTSQATFDTTPVASCP